MDHLHNELAEEEEIIQSSTRYLSKSLNLNNLTYLQSLEYKKLLSFLSKLNAFLSVFFKNLFKGTRFYSDFENIVLQAEPNDCSLIAKYSSIEKIDDELLLNVINIPHPLRIHLERSSSSSTTIDNNVKQEQILNKINSTPLVVLIHGLGGQSSQFEQLIAILSQCADIFTLDLPGFGNSAARDKTGDSLTEHDERDRKLMVQSILSLSDDKFSTDNVTNLLTKIINLKRQDRKIILIGHSMGTHLCLKIINKLPLQTVEALILMSPPKISAELSKKKLGVMSKFPYLFDILRVWDRIGGLDSRSVVRQVYGDDYFKRLKQLRWNLDVDSNMVLKYINGFSACTVTELQDAVSKIHNVSNKDRILILCGKDDIVTPKSNCESLLGSISPEFAPSLEFLNNCGHSIMLNRPETVSGLIYKFIESIPDLNINLGWCLQIKAMISGDKWGLKNELKWKKLTFLSGKIVNPTTGEIAPLVSMKTLRESDPDHNPKTFEMKNPQIVAIVDISSELPSYNPENFKKIQYHKMPTVSKIIPDSNNIREFITLIDEILMKQDNPASIAVHCHYGFNRTGFLICCYLIERLGWKIDDAILGFKMAREPGIKHPHFIDGIYVRYK